MAIARFAKAQSQVFIVINNLILSQTSPFKQKSNRSGSHQGTKPALTRLTVVIVYFCCFFNNFISNTRFEIPGLGQGHKGNIFHVFLSALAP
jgi:hypothetical protein